MNIVDLISSQLSGEVLGKLGGLIGANESQTRTATNAAVPALLNVFAKLASSKSGSEQLAKSMGGLDLSMLGNLVGTLGGSQASGLGSLGGSLLGSLLGGGNSLTALVDVLGKFAGLQPGIMKTLVGYLAPIVLGVIAKQFQGRPDAAGVSRLFSEQAANITGSLPKGLSLGDLTAGIVAPASRGPQGHDVPEKAGLPGWLLPLLLLGAVGLGYYLWTGSQKRQDGVVAASREVERRGPVTVERTEVIEREGKKMIDAVAETISIDPKFVEALRVGKNATELFGGLTKILGGVKDVESAQLALPELEKLSPMLQDLEGEVGKLPAEEKPAFAEFVGKNLGLLQKVIGTVMAIPGVKELLGPVVTPMVDAFTKMSR